MNKKPAVVFSVAAAVLLLSRPMMAHHSSSNYDQEHTVTMSGTVTQFEYANPHSQVHFDVKDANGKVENWSAETNPPSMLKRAGWNSETVKPGDQITVTGHLAKDGRKIIRVQKLVLPNGKDLNQRTE